jgi:hypothetical protein
MPLLLDGFLWLLLSLVPLLVLQRLLHRELQLILALFIRPVDLALWFYAFLFFPGVLLHEGSHFLAAKLMGVRTYHFSLIPRWVDEDALSFGHVVLQSSGACSSAVIGAAPLITGGLFVALVGLVHLNLPAVWDAIWLGDGVALAAAWQALLERPAFWLWFYLLFTVSSTMLPSASDRQGWLPFMLVLLLLLGVSLLAGAGPWMLAHLSAPLNQGLRLVAAVFAVSAGVHLVLLLPCYVLRKLLLRIRGLR